MTLDDFEPETEVAAEPARRILIRVAVIVTVLLLSVGGAAAAVGGAVTSLLPSPASTGPYCNPITDRCSYLSLETIEHQTGYHFPAGSVVITSSMGPGSFLDGSDYRTLTATIQLPAGSVLPLSQDSLSTISVKRTERDGQTIVIVSTSNGQSLN